MASASTSTYPEPYIIPPSSTTHTTTLILLHGTSTSGPELASALLSIRIPSAPTPGPAPSPINSKTQAESQSLTSLLPGTKFIFPTGRLRPTTVFGGRQSHAWFDVHSFADRTVGEDGAGVREGIRESVGYLGGLVEREIGVFRKAEGGRGSGDRDGDGDAGKRVVVAGFSQGAAVVGMLVLGGFVKGVGAFVGLSGWLPFRGELEGAGKRREDVRGCLRGILGMGDEEDDGLGDVRLWLGHGMADVKVRLEWGEQMRDVMKNVGVAVEMHMYEGLGHEFESGEIGEMVSFLKGTWAQFLCDEKQLDCRSLQ